MVERYEEKLRKAVEDLNVFDRLEELNNRIKMIESWKDINAVPQISQNIDNIIVISNEIKNQVYPRIVNAQNEARKSITYAEDSIIKANHVITKLKKIGTGLQSDAKNLSDASNIIIKTVQNEFNIMSGAFVAYGTALKDAGGHVTAEARQVGEEMLSAYREIKIPLERVKYYVDLVAKPKITDLPFVFLNIAMAFNHMVILSYGGQSSVIWEIIEAFNAISSEFKDLGQAFWSFGDTLYLSSMNLSNSINGSIDRIGDSITGFVNAFKKLGVNLAASFSG